MSFLTNFQDWSNKLANVSWVETDGRRKVIGNRVGYDKNSDKFKENEVVLSYDTKLVPDEESPIQIVLNLRINGHNVATWGSDGLDNTREVVEFFQKIYWKAEGIMLTDESEGRKQAEALWKTIF